MPIYEYRCPECGHQFEQMMRISDAPPPCPRCGTAEVRKLISQTSFVLKGGGWYSDHYGLKKSSTPSGEGGSSGAAAPASASGASGSSGTSGTSGTSGSSGSSGTSGSSGSSGGA